MKQFNLEEYLANPSRRVVTRDGRAVKIHCTNYNLGYRCIIAEVEGDDFSQSFTIDGKYCNIGDSPFDLFFADIKHEGWINLYKDDRGYISTGSVYTSKEEAETKVGRRDYLTTIKIEWEE